MYRDYMVEFSYKLANGTRKTEHDTTYTYSAQDAVNRIREWYGDLVQLRIEAVYADSNGRWERCEDWD